MLSACAPPPRIRLTLGGLSAAEAARRDMIRSVLAVMGANADESEGARASESTSSGA